MTKKPRTRKLASRTLSTSNLQQVSGGEAGYNDGGGYADNAGFQTWAADCARGGGFPQSIGLDSVCRSFESGMVTSYWRPTY